jgi:hypothetical protein
MKIKNVTHHILSEYNSQNKCLSDMDGASPGLKKKDTDFFNNYLAFTCMLNHPDGYLYCGVTRYNGDIFHRFNVQTKKFESLGYQPISEPYEVKIHRSLELDTDGAIYGATACLHGEDKRLDAPGGALFKYDTGTKKLEKFAIPVAHDYIQTITLDPKRRLIYGQTYPVFKFFVHHLDTGKTDNFDFTGSISHISAIDDFGCYWSTWSGKNHFLYKYDPSQKKIEWFNHSLPNAKADSNIMYANAGPIESMINGNDGWLYVGTCGGSLCRIHAESAKVEYLGHPAPTRRMPALKNFTKEILIGCCGDEKGGCIFTYNKKTGNFQVLGGIIDSATGLYLYRTHDLEIAANGHVFVAETDVPDRSSYLWEIEIG